MENGRVKAYVRVIIILSVGIFFLSAFSITTKAWANNVACPYYYEALIDVDSNANTGGSVTVVQKSEPPHDIQGIDYKVRTLLDAETFKIYEIQIWKWDGSSFIITPATYNYDLGIENGYQYNLEKANVVEFVASRAALGNPQGSMKIIYHTSRGGSIFNDYTNPFYYPQLTNIPTFSKWGIMVLSVLFGLSALWIIRKNKAAIGFLVILGFILSITGHAWAPPPPQLITLDGQVDDWEAEGVSPSLIDPYGDSSNNDEWEDIVAGYITSDMNNIYFRIDFVGGSIISCEV
jgi:hypothetical protein